MKDKIEFMRITIAYPRQYLAFLNDKQVAYVRLRGGVLFADAPDLDGETIFEHRFDDKTKGCFEDNAEEGKYLLEIENAITEWLHRNPDGGIVKTAEDILEEFYL